MRFAVVSDVHGNLTALEAVIADIKQQSPDAVYHLGDLVANGARPAEVLDRIRAAEWQGVYGNTDEMLWRPVAEQLAKPFPERQLLRRVLISEIGPVIRELIGEDRLSYLQALPLTMRFGSVFLCHASPSDPWLAPRESDGDDRFAGTFGSVGAKTVIYGHIHFPLVRRLKDLMVINTGAVSLSYDGDWRASYLLFDSGRPLLRRIEYDRDREERALLQSPLPHREWLAQILRTARYCDPF
jgi:predicted phosphodiesterase